MPRNLKNELAAPGRTLLKGNVLIADDEPTNRRTMQLILEKAGCTVTEAHDGAEAVRLALQNPPDLALIDVIMPELDGFEACRQIKGNKKTRNTPVIMVTSLQNIKDLEKGFNAGATDYVTKPFNARELLVRVKNSLSLKQSTDELRTQERRLSREIELAGILQKTMLERPPFLSRNLLINYEYCPSMNVSGDVFDQVALPDGRLCVYLADAAGHGVAAAFMASFLKSAARDAIQSSANPTPTAICTELNTRFQATIKLPTAYATLFLGIFDPAANTWDCMNCGHPSPILISKDGSASTPFTTRGALPIGLASGKAMYQKEDEVSLTTQPGDSLYFYTDGLTEALHKTTGEELGEDLLIKEAARNAAAGTSIRGAGNIIAKVHGMGYSIGEDDCSVVSIQMLDPGRILIDREIPATYEAIQDMSGLITKSLTDNQWPGTSTASIQILLFEHCNNTIQHGNLHANQTLHIQIHLHQDTAIIAIKDPGQKWNNNKKISASKNMQDELAESGRGIAIIQKIVHNKEFIYFRDTDQNAAFFLVSKNLSFPDRTPCTAAPSGAEQ